MKEFEERMKKMGFPAKIIGAAIETLRIEEQNISYPKPPNIIQEIQKIIESEYAKED